MAKAVQKTIENPDKFMECQTVSDSIRDNLMPYAMSVIISRALPAIDGMKPSQRKVLYTMYKMGLLHGERTKSANIAARTMLLNPHGDAANYQTMVRLTQNNETLLTPYVDGKGNFGKHYSRDMQCAAPRYSEARLMPIAEELFAGINKNAVDLVPNYDATRTEPVMLPVSFPTILANPTDGIAVGFASSIPSFNLAELCDAVILRIQHPKKNIRDVMPAPDFTTGGQILLDENAMEAIYQTGSGSFKIRSKYRVDAKHHVIEIYEVPFSTTEEQIIESVIDCCKSGKISSVSDIRDETDRNGLKIAIDYKRGCDPDDVMREIYARTPAESSFSCNCTILIDNRPKLLGIGAILDEWISWREGIVKRIVEYDLATAKSRLNVLNGLKRILLDIDRVIKIIRNSTDETTVVADLMKAFKIDQEQAESIAEIKLRNLNKNYILKQIADIDKVKKEIEELSKQKDSKDEIDKIIVSEMRAIKKKYGIPRKSELIAADSVAKIEKEKLNQPADYPVHVYLTKEGYVKKVADSSLRTNPEIKVKDGDQIVKEYAVSNLNEVVVCGSTGKVYKIYLSDLPDSKPSELGAYIPNVTAMNDGEKVLYADLLNEKADMLIVFENGKAARFPLSVYVTKQHRKVIKNGFCIKSKPIWFATITDEIFFGIKDSKDRILAVRSVDISVKTVATTQGIQVIKLGTRDTAKEVGSLKEFGLTSWDGLGYRRLPASGKTPKSLG